MRPQLKSDTFAVPGENGVYIRNNAQAFMMKGRTLGTWMERLTPLLDGKHELEQIRQAMPPEKQATLMNIIKILDEHQCLRDAAQDLPSTLPDTVQQTYAPSIAFLESQGNSGAYRFQQFRALPILAIGSGDDLLALAHAALETGNCHLHILDTQETATDYTRLATELAILQRDRDAELTITKIASTAWTDEANFAALAETFKLVLFLNTNSIAHLPTRVNRLARICYQTGAIFIPALLLGNELAVGPVQKPGQPACWQCFWRRYQAARGLAITNDEETLFTDEPASPMLPGIAARAIAANLLAFEGFKQGTGAAGDTLNSCVLLFELERLASAAHQVFAHPLCNICSSPFAETPEALEKEMGKLHELADAPDTHEFLRLTEQLTDERSGLFTRIEEWDFYQLPLVRCQITVAGASDPVRPVASAAGLDYQETRLLAGLAALACYVERAEDARRIHLSYPPTLFPAPLPPQAFYGWSTLASSTPQPLARMWAWHMQDHSAALVPAGLVYPRGQWNPCLNQSDIPLFRPDTPGTGIGQTWDEAVALGLCALASVLQEKEARELRWIAPPAYAEDERCAACLKMLEIMGHEVALFDVTSEHGIPSLAVYLDRQFVTTATSWNTLTAAYEVLKAAVLVAQVQHFPSPGDQASGAAGAPSVPGTTNLPLHTPDLFDRCTVLPRSLAAETAYQAAREALQNCYQHAGWQLFAVPLGNDPVTTTISCAVRMLAARQEVKA